MTVVYIDSVFVLNTLMDYLLLAATLSLAGEHFGRGRCLLGAVLGGTYAVSVFLPGCGVLASWPVKLTAGLLMAGAAFGGRRHFLRLLLLLLLISCGFAGCVLGLGLLAGSGIPMENGIFYTNLDAKVLLIAAGGAYLTLSVIFRASAKNGVQGDLLPVTVALGGRECSLTALRDTGNGLVDPGSGRPVLIVSAAGLSGLWPPELRSLLAPQALRSPVETLERLNRRGLRFRLVPYSAVGVSGGLLLAFTSDWTSIGAKRWERLLIALSPTELGGGFSALWGGGETTHGKLEKRTSSNSDTHGASAAGASALHWGRRRAAADAYPGAGGRASDPHQRKGRAKDTD